MKWGLLKMGPQAKLVVIVATIHYPTRINTPQRSLRYRSFFTLHWFTLLFFFFNFLSVTVNASKFDIALKDTQEIVNR